MLEEQVEGSGHQRRIVMHGQVEKDPQEGTATMIVQVQWGVLFTRHTQSAKLNASSLYFVTFHLWKLGLPSTKYPLCLLFYVLKIQSPWNEKKKISVINKVYFIVIYSLRYPDLACCWVLPLTQLEKIHSGSYSHQTPS